MSEGSAKESGKRFLDPIDRVSEVLFGTIMVLTFTGSLSAAEAGQAEIRDMLIGALGCNVAWGIVDAAMYLFNSVTERAHGLRTFRAVRSAAKPDAAHRILAEALPPVLASVLQPKEIEAIRKRLVELPEPVGYTRIRGEDLGAAFGVFLLVFLSTFPIVIPFLLMQDIYLALRTSNLIAIGMLFLCGYSLGAYGEGRPWRVGLMMVLVGVALVAVTIALGG